MTRKNIWMQLLTAVAILFLLSAGSHAEDKTKDNATQSGEPQSASLVVNKKRLVTFYTALDGLTPAERVERAAAALQELSRQPGFRVDSIHAVDGRSGTDIIASDERIATITEKDAQYAQGNTRLVANDFILKAKYAVIRAGAPQENRSLWKDIALCLAGFLIFLLITSLLCRATSSICDILRDIRAKRSHGIRIQNAELISADTLLDISTAIIKFLQLSLIFLMLASYALVSLAFFPDTRPISDSLIASVSISMSSLGESLLHYIPDLFTIAVIALMTYGSMFIARFLFNALRDGSIRLADFHPDWAMPSYKLARVIILFFGLVCIMPYLPGSDTPAFKQVGLLAGVLLSLGSSSMISNVMAGIVLTYTNAFQIGDRVTIAENTGDIIERTLFVTRLKTPKGEIVSIPNAPILSSNIVNYSAEGRSGRLILHKTITIGYDVPWTKVTELLLAAAKSTRHVLQDPAPFVFQSSLDNYYVSYEINVYTDHPHQMLEIYSELHANILDTFFASGTEIMSPQYTCIRDGNQPAIPPECLPENHVPASFKVTTLTNTRS